MYDLSVFELDEGVEHSDFWLLNSYTGVLTPMSLASYVDQHRHGCQYGAEMLPFPRNAAVDFRAKDGMTWLCVNRVEPEDIPEREDRYRQRILGFIENYDTVWGDVVAEMMGRYEHLRSADLHVLGNFELVLHFEDAWQVRGRMWDLHYLMMNGIFGLYVLFEQQCKELLGVDDRDPIFHKLLTGFDNKKFQADRGLWLLAQRAFELHLADAVLAANLERLRETFAETADGRQWLAEFDAYLDEFGWQGNSIFEFSAAPWVVDPTPALLFIVQFVRQGQAFSLDGQRALLAAERETAIADVLARVPEDHRGWFELLLQGAQHAGSFSEEHDWYLDLYTCALMHRALTACGMRLAEAGALDAADDVFFLVPDEVRKALYRPQMFRLQTVVARRRAAWEVNRMREYPPILGDVPFDEAMGQVAANADPVTLKVVLGSIPQVNDELGADLYGVTGSTGIAEGPARVVSTVNDLALVQPGDVLVAANTSVSWTPIFGLLSAVVVDRGASLSHAAIVSREYGIPCVINTFRATQTIKTGQRLRVDGDQGVVYILDEAHTA